MTMEEAIERFNGIINAMSISIAQSKFYPSKAELNELCDMAIEALQAQPTHGRLIDADALSKKLCGTTIFIKDGEVFKRMINDAPTVQADRPHGEWIETTSGTICSNCGEYPYDDGEYHIANWHSDFCPSCGADMRKENK